MRVAVVHASHTPHTQARLRAAAAASPDDEVVALAIARSQGDYTWPATEIGTEDGYRAETLPGSADYWELSYLKIRRRLSAALSRIDPDVVFLPGWGFKEGLSGLGWSLRERVPRVLVSDSFEEARGTRTLGRMVKGQIASLFQSSLTAGSPQVRYLDKLGIASERCFVGCDVVDNDFFAGGGDRTSPGQGDMELLSCLRLIPRKNVSRVLEWLATEPVGWRWTIAGDGPQRALIERRIDELGLSSRVKLLGHVDHLELPDLYARFHAYLQPSSEGETWGLAVNEAMASGLPVIVSTKCGCHEDLVRLSINGYLFDPFSASSFKAALDRFVAERHRWEEMGRASVSIVSDWDLGLYARSFWSAARIATQTRAKRDLAALVAKAL